MSPVSPEEAAERRRRLRVIAAVAVALVLAVGALRWGADRAATSAAERLRATLDATATGVRPADVVAAGAPDAPPGPAARLLDRPELVLVDRPDATSVRLVYRPQGWQAGLSPRCVVLTLTPTDHTLSVRGRACGLDRPAPLPTGSS